MQKDVIYIDTEDDITAIIGKVKAAEHKIVAIVPPKRIGAIQSTVNLKLVHRAAEQAGKHLVIISNNAALVALAASASIPVAKNLQSKPELAEIPALEIDDGDDVIDGDAINVKGADAAIDSLAAAEGAEKTSADVTKKSLGVAAVKGKAKIPDFNKFRKKFFLIIAAVVLLVGGLVWALVFAPTAKIIITARTSDTALNTQVKLGSNLTTSLTDGTIKIVTKTSKKDVSVPFSATGEKNVGEKATGTVKFSQQSLTSTSIPAGTTLTAAGLNFTTNSAVTVPASDRNGVGCFPTACPGTATVTVTAAEGGAKYNGTSGSLSGAPSDVTATFASSTSGGSDKMVIIVQQSDVDAVQNQVVSDSDVEAARKALVKQVGSDYVTIESSFKADKTAVKPSPAVDGEATGGKGALAGSVTFSIVAVPKSELGTFLKAYFDQAIDGKTNQKVYDTGVGTVSFTNVNAVDGGYTANLTANGRIGPKIDENTVKDFARGKRFGEIQSYAQAISGVENVDVKFAPFWVNSAPNDTKRISVEFKVND